MTERGAWAPAWASRRRWKPRGRFRNDLKHRLDVVRIALPLLRAQREGIEMLARHFPGPRIVSWAWSPSV